MLFTKLLSAQFSCLHAYAIALTLLVMHAALQESRLPGYEQLYNDSMRRRLKLEALAQLPPEEATFRPRVSPTGLAAARRLAGDMVCRWHCHRGMPAVHGFRPIARCKSACCPDFLTARHSSSLPRCLQVNTSSVVLKRLLEGQEGEVPLGGSDDVATRWVPVLHSFRYPAHSHRPFSCSCAGANLLTNPACPFARRRLLERGRRYQEKLAAAQREAEEAPRDPATGRPLFQPKTHRPPIYDRNPDGAVELGSREDGHMLGMAALQSHAFVGPASTAGPSAICICNGRTCCNDQRPNASAPYWCNNFVQGRPLASACTASRRSGTIRWVAVVAVHCCATFACCLSLAISCATAC